MGCLRYWTWCSYGSVTFKWALGSLPPQLSCRNTDRTTGISRTIISCLHWKSVWEKWNECMRGGEIMKTKEIRWNVFLLLLFLDTLRSLSGACFSLFWVASLLIGVLSCIPPSCMPPKGAGNYSVCLSSAIFSPLEVAWFWKGKSKDAILYECLRIWIGLLPRRALRTSPFQI